MDILVNKIILLFIVIIVTLNYKTLHTTTKPRFILIIVFLKVAPCVIMLPSKTLKGSYEKNNTSLTHVQ